MFCLHGVGVVRPLRTSYSRPNPSKNVGYNEGCHIARCAKSNNLKGLESKSGGEGEIRTPDTVARMPHFECGAFNHSATSPGREGM